VIANAAFLSAMVLLLLAFVVLGDVSFLAPYKYLLLGPYLWSILGFATLVFLNLFALFYLTGRALFLKDTGRKLAHVEKQLRTGDTIVRDLSERLAEED
jgi:hypothetical protein